MSIPVQYNPHYWEKWILPVGTCFTLVLPKFQESHKNLRFLYFSLQKDKSFNVFLHQKGLLNMLPIASFEFTSVVISPNSGFTYELKYQLNKVLEFDGNPCERDPTYSFSKCVNDEGNQAALKKLACQTPFGPKRNQTCTELEKMREAVRIHDQVMMNSSCLYPCQYLGNFYISKNIEPAGQHLFLFKRFVQKQETKPTYSSIDLFAALGGYLGSFLGISLFHLKDCFAFFLKKFVQQN